MLKLTRLPLIACACLALAGPAVGQSTNAAQSDVPQWFAEMLDSSKLPRMTGAQEIFASKASTMVVVREKVGDATSATRALFAADGWQEYGPPFAQRAKSDRFSNLTLKKGPHLLNISISEAPAQGGATAISYNPVVMHNELPFPKDATEIEFDPERPHLNCLVATPAQETLLFFAKELTALGYAEWSLKTSAKKPAGQNAGEITKTGGYAYFVHDSKKPLQLVLAQQGDKLKVELKAVPQPQLEAQARQARNAAETAMVDVSTLPRPAGFYVKDEDARKNDQYSLHYMVPDTIAGTRAKVSKVLGDEGWIAYEEPLGRSDQHHLKLKKGAQGVSIHFTFNGDDKTRSGVWITSERLYINVPFPPGATDIVYDYRRPLMDAIAPGTVDDVLAFFQRELGELGWHAWSAEDSARYPNATLEEKIDDGMRAYFARDPRDKRDPIQVSLGHRKDGRVDIEVRVPPFARPQELSAGRETMGLPVPERANGSSGRGGATQKQIGATVAAERDVVLKFYRRELAKLNWKEDARGPVANGDDIVLNFTTADGKPAALKLGFEYDLTTVELVQQLPDKEVLARAKAKQEAEEAARKRAEEWLNPPKVLEAMKGADAPIPVPDGAEKVDFNATRGDIKFVSDARVKEVTAFYRRALPPLGFKELLTNIDDDKMASLHFARNGKRLYVSISRFRDTTDVRSYGEALIAFAGDARAQQALKAVAPAQRTGNASTAAQPAMDELEADETDGLPVPKQTTLSLGTATPFGREREASVRASVGSTLAFYRRELTKLGWSEQQKGAVINANAVKLAFTTPGGTGSLILGRKDAETTVKLTERTPANAEKKGVVARPGMAMVLLASALDTEVTVTIDRQTIRLAPNAGAGKQDTGPKLELKPGTYKASVKVPGKPALTQEVKLASGQTIGLLIGPGGLVPLPLN